MNNNQLRSRERLLWGKFGEESLNNSKIIILGSSILISEISILLAYSGIGYLTLVDDQIQQENDYGISFTNNGQKNKTIGQYKIKLIKEYLENSNPNLKINIQCIYQSPLKYLNSQLNNINNYLINYDILICCNISNKIIYQIFYKFKDNQLYNLSFIINLKSKGYMGMYQIFYLKSNYFTLDFSNENKNISLLKGLQLSNPIDKLLQYYYQIDFDKINDIEKSKIPFLLLLIKCKFNSIDKNNNIQKKDICIKYLKDNCQFKNNKNFIQAINNINLIFLESQDFFKKLKFKKDDNFNLKINKINNITDIYKILLQEIYIFFQIYNRIPVTNELPDIYCDTNSYLKIQKIYNDQFSSDSNKIYQFISNKYKNLNNSIQITLEFVQFICKYLYCLKIVEFKNTFTYIYLNNNNKYPNLEIKKKLKDIIIEDLDINNNNLFKLKKKIKLNNSLLIQFLLFDFFDIIKDNKYKLIDLKEHFKDYLFEFDLLDILEIPENEILFEM